MASIRYPQSPVTAMISVIIPTRNRKNLLCECLQRLAPGAQTLDEGKYEVIVTDDGNIGVTQAFIASQFPWARIQQGPCRGPAANRNSGARGAQGQFLVFTDDDCLPAPEWLMAFFKAISTETQVYEGRTVCKAGLASPMVHAPLNLKGGQLWSCNFMIARDFFYEMGGFDERFPFAAMEDVDLRERIRARDAEIRFVEGAVIDHPPRRISFIRQQAASHESHVIYWSAHEGSKMRLMQYLCYVSKARIRNLLLRSYGWDSVVAVASFVMELILIISKMKSWKRKHGLS